MNGLTKLERDLGAIFGPGPRRAQKRKAEPSKPATPRFVVFVGSNGQVARPAPGFEHLQAKELGRFATLQKARAAQAEYNAAHTDGDEYAWEPDAL